MVNVSSWGRLERLPHTMVPLDDRQRAGRIVSRHAPGLAYGMGRSYGDVCLNPRGTLWTTTGLDRFISFDDDTGRLVCEAGVRLRDIQRVFVPRGWMLPVSPGTQLVTVGGAIANDVHGKSHHRQGSFGDHVRHLTLLRTADEILQCGPGHEPDWWAATIGGLGLTGVILTAELQLMRVPGPWIDVETLPFAGTSDFFALADASEADWDHTVAWIDCASRIPRGIFMRGRPTVSTHRPEPAARSLTMRWTPPVSLIRRSSLRLFNTGYFEWQRWRAGRRIVHYEPFLYPLDNVLEWNRVYGPRGFYQYQSVVPPRERQAATDAMLADVARSGEGSVLAVLKTFGNRSGPGMLSFPRPGVTLALDFPNDGARTLRLFERLDAIVESAGGALYPAKDARMPRRLFEQGYPRLTEFQRFRDPGITSALSRRLMGS
jgi:FAD/FMN-containing dehydrogenase